MSRYTVITGASGGIGRALADEFAAHGHNLVLVARNKKKLESARADILKDNDIDVKVFPLDLTDLSAIDGLHRFCADNGLDVDCLVNNAGMGADGEFTELGLGRQEDIIKLNISALVKTFYLFLPDMKAKGTGTVVNIGSTTAFAPLAHEAVYSSSKAFVVSFSQALYEEYRKYGVTVSVVCPGVTNTGFFDSAGFQMNNFKGADPKDFARFAYGRIQKRKPFSVHRASNKAVALFGRLFPRGLVRRVSAEVG